MPKSTMVMNTTCNGSYKWCLCLLLLIVIISVYSTMHYICISHVYYMLQWSPLNKMMTPYHSYFQANDIHFIICLVMIMLHQLTRWNLIESFIFMCVSYKSKSKKQKILFLSFFVGFIDDINSKHNNLHPTFECKRW